MKFNRVFEKLLWNVSKLVFSRIFDTQHSKLAWADFAEFNFSGRRQHLSFFSNSIKKAFRTKNVNSFFENFIP